MNTWRAPHLQVTTSLLLHKQLTAARAQASSLLLLFFFFFFFLFFFISFFYPSGEQNFILQFNLQGPDNRTNKYINT